MKTVIKSLIIFGCLVIFGCKNSEESALKIEEQQPAEALADGQILVTQTQFKNAKMALGNVSENDFNEEVKVSGKIDVPPKNKASVSVPVGGYVKTTKLLVGDKVRKGQVLLTIQNPDFIEIQQQYLEISRQLSYLKSEFERNKTLLSENLISKKKFLKAESDYQTALARHSGLKQQLQALHISPQRVASGTISSIISVFAPINGTISEVNAIKGAYVSPATEIMQIIDNEHIHVELSVFEKDIMKLKKGQEIKFKLPENSDETFEATVHLIGATISENRTVDVHGHLKNEDKHNFLTGMFVDATIITDSKKMKSLPSDAVVEVDGDFYALKLIKKTANDYLFEKVKIDVTQKNENFVAIKNDFSKEAVFLVKNAFNLISE